MTELTDPQPFSLEGDVTFAPTYFPERVKVRKQHELDRTSGFCGGEDVTKKGVKNREFHITGKLRGKEQNTFKEVLDSSGEFELISAAGVYRVRLKEGEYDGPVGHDHETGSLLWQYTLDLVSTGEDEQQGAGTGIVSTGNTGGS